MKAVPAMSACTDSAPHARRAVASPHNAST
jgi:hypothetical protein